LFKLRNIFKKKSSKKKFEDFFSEELNDIRIKIINSKPGSSEYFFYKGCEASIEMIIDKLEG
jgi:hypothetical protein